jgi:hypothetical protein
MIWKRVMNIEENGDNEEIKLYTINLLFIEIFFFQNNLLNKLKQQ